VKVALVGSPNVFYTLYRLDDDFGKYFKVQVDFHTEVDRDTQAERAYGRFIRVLCQREKLLPFTAAATARVVEYGARWVEHQDRLSAQFGKVADLVRESDYWARQVDQAVVRRGDSAEGTAPPGGAAGGAGPARDPGGPADCHQ
jgi:predicted ATP-dependent protease